MLVMLQFGCTGHTETSTGATQYDKTAILKISLLKNGVVQDDHRAVTMRERDALLAVQASKSGVVWYHREAGT